MSAQIVITGAASGIGAAVFYSLKASGRKCLGIDRTAQPDAGIVACDLADPDSIRACVGAIVGPVAGVAHIAGVSGTLDAETVLRVNYLGARRFVDTVLPKVSDGGSIVLVSSLAARRCAWDVARLRAALAITDWSDALISLGAATIGGGEAYEISKRLLLAWLPYATAAGSERRIRVNAITPGPVETPLLPGFRESMGADRIEAARNLVGRHARAEEIATAILFLLGPASSWINGTEIVADGGLTALREAAVA
jgi:NAD(P)-dependent dehydrogenase (short-subunit alcohol dehydrogenase family)